LAALRDSFKVAGEGSGVRGTEGKPEEVRGKDADRSMQLLDKKNQMLYYWYA
jgi:hypothetical protein